MARICLIDPHPALHLALARRGMSTTDTPDAALMIVPAAAHVDVAAMLAALRARWPIPILLLVAGGEGALIAAIDAGADDALPAEASPALIAARVAALVRRGGGRLIVRGELVIDTVERKAWRAGRPIELLPREYRLLLELAQCPGTVIARTALLERVCGIGFDPGTNVLDVHVSRLRRKLDRGAGFAMLQTEKGVGYRLVAPPLRPLSGSDAFAIAATRAAG